VAEGGGLLNRYTLQRRIEGSNPSVSAISFLSVTRMPAPAGGGASRSPSVSGRESFLRIAGAGEASGDALRPVLSKPLPQSLHGRATAAGGTAAAKVHGLHALGPIVTD
jgi:hypothetical protein